MSDAANLTRFRCPQCRSRYMIDIATETIPYLCPTCHVELEPHGKKVDPSAVTKEISSLVGKAPERSPNPPTPALAAQIAERREIDYLRKIYFWVRLTAGLAAAGLIAGLCAAVFR